MVLLKVPLTNWFGSSGILVARDDRIEIELAAVEQDSQTVVLK